MDIEDIDDGLKSTSPDLDLSNTTFLHKDTVKYFHEDIVNKTIEKIVKYQQGQDLL